MGADQVTDKMTNSPKHGRPYVIFSLWWMCIVYCVSHGLISISKIQYCKIHQVDIESEKIVFSISLCMYTFTHCIAMAIKPKFKRNEVMTYFIFGVGGNSLLFFFSLPITFLSWECF